VRTRIGSAGSTSDSWRNGGSRGSTGPAFSREEWWQSILRGIDAADTFIFVLSPDSLRSEVCPKEIDHAAAVGKRIVPVVCRDIDHMEVHPVLSKLNYIFLRTEQEQNENLGKLLQALDTDLDHVRAHTKFLIRAREWEARGRSKGYLLEGGLLREADLWLAQVGRKQPAPTELHSQYILASRAAARRSQRITTSTVAGGMVIALGLAAVAGWYYKQAEEGRVEAEKQTKVAETQTIVAQEQTKLAEEQRSKATERQKEAEAQKKVADEQRAKAEEQTRIARVQAGNGLMLRAKSQRLSSNSAFYAALAMGFVGLGKAETDERFPVLFGGLEAAIKAADADRTVDLAPGRPFLWSSPIGINDGNELRSVAFSSDGRILASGSAVGKSSCGTFRVAGRLQH